MGGYGRSAACDGGVPSQRSSLQGRALNGFQVSEPLRETEIEMAERHVREGDRHLIVQQEIIDCLKDHGRSTFEAERLLTNMRVLQRMHREHLARLQHA